MKKLLSIALGLLLAMQLALPVFATETPEELVDTTEETVLTGGEVEEPVDSSSVPVVEEAPTEPVVEKLEAEEILVEEEVVDIDEPGDNMRLANWKKGLLLLLRVATMTM